MKIIFFKTILAVLIVISSTIHAVSQRKDEINDISFVCGPCGCVDDGKHFDKPGLCPSCGMVLYASYKDMAHLPDQHHDHMIGNGKKVAILIFPGADIIDFAGPWEIFIQAGMQVFTVAEKDT